MTMGALSLKGLTSDVGRRAAFHALSRLSYGPNPGDVDRVLDQGIEPWILEQVHPPTSDPEAEGRLRAFPAIGYSTSQILAMFNADNRSIGVVNGDLYSAKLVRSVHGQNQLLE